MTVRPTQAVVIHLATHEERLARLVAEAFESWFRDNARPALGDDAPEILNVAVRDLDEADPRAPFGIRDRLLGRACS